MSKGSKQRPMSVPKSKFNESFDKIFKNPAIGATTDITVYGESSMECDEGAKKAFKRINHRIERQLKNGKD